ncbi:terminase large subunit domain-containing protein [Xenorhabdus bovienii]|uniref:terminase large subunit domain-containing protein n=1 Tax=Xenorhabdus bovienii TaxID=40576 RepID=UPI00237CD84A|nr:terminase family protein [Xenorhabdus bovienii]MDE1492796.1 terminase family protein [Xenorhabdus bovienii]
MNNIILNLSPDVVDHIRHQFVKGLFVWQARWKANQHHRNRFLHKRRQAGADYYFVLEALINAHLTGRNKIFMTNEELLPNFVHNIAQYFPRQQERLIENAEEIRLLTLSNGAEIRFLHENSCPVSICGDVYVSEWAYSDDPIKLIRLALMISIHTKWRRTFYSSRSSGDNGEAAYKEFFTRNQIQGEAAFFDTVTFFDSENFLNEDLLMKTRSRKDFEEMYLCRLPHARW